MTVALEDIRSQSQEETIAKPSLDARIGRDTSDTRIGKDSPFTFGERYLKDENDVFNHNAWDHVEWGEEQVEEMKKLIEKQYDHPVKDFDKQMYNANPAKYWDIFYKNNRENFFKDRKWLQIEFPQLYEVTGEEYTEPTVIFEIGCGAGNTFFPVLEQNKNPNLKIFASDYSKVAVDLVKANPVFTESHAKKIAYSSVWDLANPEGNLPEDMEPNSADFVIMIFVFSALHPDQWAHAINNLSKILKPGGKILFRDYGRYDLAQVRFKKNRLLDDNFYIRGDGTRVYFFTEEELRTIFTVEGPFKEEKIGTDRRLLVNRKKQLKMYRNWLQAVFEAN
ncbi:uncharacterized protein KQ657_000022 [Scheffersomyces spartinae]|uniref:tRNA N(3)-methylcytidine methyltransferase n=1 Tax=Scheffersomyces spartinae TaxID=45513 RepID=A0A9P7VDA7_9ASCO|nr:uncharacterized protein KQ657_000022 [Scheffersomyces spartinae]KAG7196015.1 hypothetical protein KQ657_000022 [Scheffersomyces spartinae]